MGAISAEENEQNIVTVQRRHGERSSSSRLPGCWRAGSCSIKKVGDHVARGERVGLIKFGSRVDVILPAAAAIRVKVGDHVAGGSSVLAMAPVACVRDSANRRRRDERSSLPNITPTIPGHAPHARGCTYCRRCLPRPTSRPAITRSRRPFWARQAIPGTSITPPRRLDLPFCLTGSTAASPA